MPLDRLLLVPVVLSGVLGGRLVALGVGLVAAMLFSGRYTPVFGPRILPFLVVQAVFGVDRYDRGEVLLHGDTLDEARAQHIVFTTADMREGMTAFFERRDPVFTGE